MKKNLLTLIVIFCTTSCFAQWQTIACSTLGPTIINLDIFSVAFNDSLHGFIAGKDMPMNGVPNKGYILETNNAGWNLDTLLIVDSMQFNKIIICDSMTLFATGGFYPNHGVVAKSNDFGNTWNLLFFNDYLFSICFSNDSIGYMTSTYGNIYKTIDKGNTWVNIFSTPNTSFSSIGFFDDTNGIISGDSTFITQNGGNTWTNLGINSIYSYESNDISIVTNQIGFLAIGTKLYKSTNAGLTWDTVGQLSNYIGNFLPVKTLFFPNDSIGYLTNQHNFYKTINGGLTWGQQSATIIGTFWDDLRDNFFLNADNGFMVGLSQLYRTFDGGGGIVDVRNLQNKIHIRLYPNPASKLLNIEINDLNKTTIKIIDLNGQILLETVIKGNEIINLSEFENGLYFVNVLNDNSVTTEKLLIVK